MYDKELVLGLKMIGHKGLTRASSPWNNAFSSNALAPLCFANDRTLSI